MAGTFDIDQSLVICGTHHMLLNYERVVTSWDSLKEN